jgi:hypothetical protein
MILGALCCAKSDADSRNSRKVKKHFIVLIVGWLSQPNVYLVFGNAFQQIYGEKFKINLIVIF